METEITKFPMEKLLESGPSLLVVPKSVGETPVDRYIQTPNVGETLPSGESLVAIIRIALLSTPDEIKVTGASRDGSTFWIELEKRCYEGQLAGNDPMMALVQVDLGRLARGHYEVVVAETTLGFLDLKHPENAANPTVALQRLRFEVR